MSVDLTRKLLALGLVQREEVQHVLFQHVTRRVPLARLLSDLRLPGSQSLEDELAKSDAPFVRTVAPVTRLVEALPSGLCRALLALPIRQDVLTRTVDVATFDPRDPHVAREFGYHLQTPIRLIRAPLTALEEALRRLEESRPLPEPPRPAQDRVARRTPPYLLRSQIEATAGSIPQLRVPSEPPIPLVRRSESLPVNNSMGALRSSTDRPSGPFSPHAPRGPFPDPSPLYDAIRHATSRDEVIDLLLNGLAMLAGRTGTFVVRKTEYQGWRCNETLADPEAFRGIRIPTDVPSIFATAAATGFYLGPLPANSVHAELLSVMGGIASEVAVSPLRVQGRLALLLFLDDIGDTMLATRRAEELGRVAGERLSRLVRGG
ncbi:MAG: hypothetical protein RMJ98_03110 [Myxococcales bacterium]|nr:hypothetical protein [Polyangiaceae bacterium]MDW8248279.1 hypothetical protein [Myxococcales bacterium]